MTPRDDQFGDERGTIRLPVACLLAVCLAGALYLGYCGVTGYLEQRAGTRYYGTLAGEVLANVPTSAPAPTPAPTDAPPPATPDETQDATPGEATADEADAREDVTEAPAPEGTPEPTTTPAPTPTPAATATADPTATPAPTVSAAPAATPEPTPRSAIDFDALRETCPDVMGWVRIEGTKIDYPIVQGEDNLFYLKHLPDGTANEAGSIMMDCANHPDFTDDVTILHGHHMRSGAMFGDLDLYKSAGYYAEHPMMRLFTPDGDYDVAIFAAYSVDGATFAYPTVFTGRAGFDEFLHRARSRSCFTTDVEVGYGDRILMLSTCAYSYENERFLVVGKILENEAE